MWAWLKQDIVEAGKWPLMLCFLAFVTTFVTTRGITRLIRAGHGPFKNVVTTSGTHIHHAVPGMILLVVGAFIAVATAGLGVWFGIAAVMIGSGVSLVLDEFALILHLQDVYWTNEGRLSVNLVSLTAAYLGLALTGLSPIGVDDVGGGELAVRLGGIGFVALHAALIVVCVFKGKYRLAIIALPIPVVAFAGALRLARPGSLWARRLYEPARVEAAKRRAERFDDRWGPLLLRWDRIVGGLPDGPDPAREPTGS
jgi:hypothetical protein